ncbi:helix-turn-helix transcriptional regulator [Egbenema bharatensis]|uniref:helix-turn-helix transcriptional regulator n=1 Tax=Egbenema bharatensis TaxID=3463334 RepID=UPI003A891518
MAIALSETTWYELWNQSRSQSTLADPDDGGDRLVICPTPLATGYKRDIALRNGIDLTLHRFKFHDDVAVTHEQSEDTGFLEFVFNLSSRSSLENGVALTAGQYCLLGRFSPEQETLVYFAQEPTVGVDIHIEPEAFQTLLAGNTDPSGIIERLPSDLQRMIAGDPTITVSSPQPISPAMQVDLQQILNCPYHGVVKQLYLESKSLEVLALWLEQALCTPAPKPTCARLQSDEIDRIHHARDILIQQMDHPPSLTDLAHQVGLNDCTLKRGFRQVFGYTVFGYLQQHRLEQARSLLLDHQLTITAIAHRVGYTNLCAFSTAFRKKFGVSPREMRG